jgi:hypothetical protein
LRFGEALPAASSWRIVSLFAVSGPYLPAHRIGSAERRFVATYYQHANLGELHVDGTQPPDRNAQFGHINAKAKDCV